MSTATGGSPDYILVAKGQRLTELWHHSILPQLRNKNSVQSPWQHTDVIVLLQLCDVIKQWLTGCDRNGRYHDLLCLTVNVSHLFVSLLLLLFLPLRVCWHKSFMKWHFSNSSPVNQTRQEAEEGWCEEVRWGEVRRCLHLSPLCPPGAVRLHPRRHLGGVSLRWHSNSSQSAALSLLWDEPIGSSDQLQSDQRGVQGNVLIIYWCHDDHTLSTAVVIFCFWKYWSQILIITLMMIVMMILMM